MNKSTTLNKGVVLALYFSVAFVVAAFLGGEPASARGFYYVLWLLLYRYIWKHREQLAARLQRSPFGEIPTFIGIGIFMILVEETFAGLAVNILAVSDISALFASIPQYYANNLLLLSGFIIAWYILSKSFDYSRKEILVLVGIFGLFAEKIIIHILTIPPLGLALILPTMFTYMAIITPSLLALRTTGKRSLARPLHYLVGLLFPLLVSLPLLLLHAKLSQMGLIDPAILQK